MCVRENIDWLAFAAARVLHPALGCRSQVACPGGVARSAAAASTAVWTQSEPATQRISRRLPVRALPDDPPRLSLDTQSTHTYHLPLTFSSLAFAPPLPPLPRLPLPLQRIRHGLGAGGINASAVVYGGSKGCLSAKTAKTVFFLPRPEPVVVYDDLTAIYKWRRPISTSLPYRGVSGYGQDALDSWSGRAQHRIAEEVLPAPMGCWTSAWPKEGRFALLRVFPPFRRALSSPPIGCWHCFPSSFREAPA